ncbi:MAG: aminodeoxychorismate/anthranilate synthase component II [Ignavibacteriaceae bacterium]|nr:aminodeoxychorismate/anthranilate synthase component II [Ignavibacteriaceae bacterium]
MNILVIDNYDSFTYNLVQLVGSSGHNIIVKRNDAVTIEEILQMAPDKILLSPGPGKPEDSKITLDILRELSSSIPILGVCLGHQAIGIVFGAKVSRAPFIMHGKTSSITHDNQGVFKNLAQGFTATRYHSLVIERESIQKPLMITAKSEDNLIMGVRHTSLPVEGIQFHPESILTTEGNRLIQNWLEL